MIYRSQVGSETFALIKTGQRIIEPRLYDATHKSIKVGDLMVFVCTDQELVAKVVGLLRFGSFKELFNAYPTERFGKNEQVLLSDMKRFYSNDQELAHGVVGIKIHLLKK